MSTNGFLTVNIREEWGRNEPQFRTADGEIRAAVRNPNGPRAARIGTSWVRRQRRNCIGLLVVKMRRVE